MAKKLAIILIVLCVATVANAETSMKIGTRLGYNTQKVGSADMGMLGLGAGLVFDIPVGSIFISPELAFLYRNNWSMETIDLASNEVADWTQTEMAISIPIIFKFFISFFYSSLGFQIDIPIAAKECLDSNCIDMDGKGNRSERTAVDVGLVWGFGCMISSNFGIDFRGVNGFLPHFKYKIEAVPGAPPVKTESGTMSSYGFGISYFFL